jgi:hypothetical protein
MLRGRLLLLMLVATAANANSIFNITFNPVADIAFDSESQRYFFTGTIVTDGVCSLCTIEQNFDAITSDGIISIITGPTGLELGTPRSLDLLLGGTVSLDVTNGVLSGFITFLQIDDFVEFGDTITSCIYGEPCLKGPNAYDWGAEGLATEWDTYAISSVPEPSSWLMLAAITVHMVLRHRRRFSAFRTKSNESFYR